MPAPARRLCCLLLLAASCGCPLPPAGTPELELRIPAGEAASTGSYEVIVRWPEALAERLVGERDGTVAGLWFHDLDGDGRGEVLVATQSAGSGSHGGLELWRRMCDGTWTGQPAPALSPEQEQGYGGHDRFRVGPEGVTREFPLYAEGDSNAAPSGGSRRLRLDGDAWRAAG